MIERTSKETALPKAVRGRTAIAETPITTRSRVRLPAVDRRNIEQRLRRVLAPFGPRIERASIRFEDTDGPRHGQRGLRCAIEVVFSGAESVIIEQRATTVQETVRRAIPRVSRSVRRCADSSARKTPRPTTRQAARQVAGPPQQRAQIGDNGSLIGARVGRGPVNLAAALERPEKLRRDALVDTAQPGTSATDRKAGGVASARRNSRQNADGTAYALEDSRGKPSRKSTRAGKNRVKPATQLTRRAQRKVRSPQARALRGS
jgi:hypothetical protein